jgi:hypothetical protein
LYELLVDVSDNVSDMITFGPSSDEEKQREIEGEVRDLFTKLIRFYRKNHIYLNRGSCERIDSLVKKINSSFVSFVFARLTPNQDKVTIWQEAKEVMDRDVPPLLDELENQFRSNLSLT